MTSIPVASINGTSEFMRSYATQNIEARTLIHHSLHASTFYSYFKCLHMDCLSNFMKLYDKVVYRLESWFKLQPFI